MLPTVLQALGRAAASTSRMVGGGGGAEISCRRPRKGACVWGDLEHAEWAALTLGLVQAWPLLTSCCFCPEL